MGYPHEMEHGSRRNGLVAKRQEDQGVQATNEAKGGRRHESAAVNTAYSPARIWDNVELL